MVSELHVISTVFPDHYAIIGETTARAIVDGKQPDDAEGGHEFGVGETIALMTAAIMLVREIRKLIDDFSDKPVTGDAKKVIIVERIREQSPQIISSYPELDQRLSAVVEEVLKSGS